jgi:hypothetical protein
MPPQLLLAPADFVRLWPSLRRMEARGAMFTQTVQVRGDPPLSSSLSLMEALEGQAVRPGSLHPPTPEHIRRKTAIEDRLDRILSSARDDR